MIKEENVDVHISYRNITHYKNLGYSVKLHDICKIKPRDLSNVSHQKITAICDKCGNERIIAYHKYLENENRCGYYGCKSCSNEKRELTSIERFGVSNYAKTDECKNRISENNITKYGVKTTLLEKNTKDKISKTIFERYGVNEILSSGEIRNKSKITKIERYGDNYYRTSKTELEIFQFVKNNCDHNVLHNDNLLLGQELDIYIPELKLAIEFNGIFWHSDKFRDKKYHLNKTELCEKQGVQLIQIWEDDWKYKKEIVKSMILNKLGKIKNKIFARKCDIKEINDNILVKNFLINNHLQGFVGSKIKLGLFYQNELVSLMTFGQQRKSMGSKASENIFELLRFCNKLNINIVGGASKLFNYFIKNYNPKEIITYADRCWSNGNMYLKLGFNFMKKTKPNYNYFDRKLIKYNRFNFRKDILVKNGFDPMKSEFEIMDTLLFYRVFNSGNLKFIFKPIKNKIL